MSKNDKISPSPPPFDAQLEAFVLGSIINSTDRLIEVIDLLSPQTFYVEEHAIVFGHIVNLFKQGIYPDLLTIAIECRKKSPQIRPEFLSKLCENQSFVDIEFKCRYLGELAIRRKLIEETHQITKISYDLGQDIFDTLESHQLRIADTINQYTKSGIKSAYDLSTEAIRELDEMRHLPDGLTGVPSGFSDLDRITSGWQSPDLIIIAARPAMGKTAFVLSMARNIGVFFKKPIAIFSLEMSGTQLIKRMISIQTEVNSQSFRSGKLSDAEFLKIHQNIGPLIEAPIYFDDSASLNILDLKTKATRMKKQHGIEMIIIDYLQLMSAGTSSVGTREQEISTISRSLKMLAKELNIPIIALSQLSRNVETRGGDKRPVLSDLRESGAIEQDADIVAFIHRPEYYGIIVDENGDSTIGLAELIIAKHRNGSLETAKFKYIPQYTKFDNISTNIVNFTDLKPNQNFEEPPTKDEIPF